MANGSGAFGAGQILALVIAGIKGCYTGLTATSANNARYLSGGEAAQHPSGPKSGLFGSQIG